MGSPTENPEGPKKKGQPERELSLESFAQSDGSPYEIPDWSQDPSDQALRAELRRILQEAIAALPETYRLVFTLRDMEGFSTVETARMLDISPQAVKTRLHRARLFLRERIAHLYGREKKDEN